MRYEIEAWIGENKKIMAIKQFRTFTGLGLKESKYAVDFYCANGYWKPEDLKMLEGDESSKFSPEVWESLKLVKENLFKGRKILAIKEFRTLTGSGLADAKRVVDYLEEHGEFREQDLSSLMLQESTKPVSHPTDDPGWESVEALVGENKKIMAIKMCRELTGFGLREAKEAVEFFMVNNYWDHNLYNGDHSPKTISAADREKEEFRLTVEQLGPVKKIEAIKQIRSYFGIGLKEAKEVVDNFLSKGVWKAGLWSSPTSNYEPSQNTVPTESAITPNKIVLTPLNPHNYNEIDKDLVDILSNRLAREVRPILIVETKKGVDRGYLVMLSERAYFFRHLFDEFMIETEIDYREVSSVEVETRYGVRELVVNLTYFNERFSGISDEDTKAVKQVFLKHF